MITTTGVFSHAALIAAIQEVGVDNVMFSIDYPFESTEKRSSSSEPRRWLPLTRREWRTRTPSGSSGSTNSRETSLTLKASETE